MAPGRRRRHRYSPGGCDRGSRAGTCGERRRSAARAAGRRRRGARHGATDAAGRARRRHARGAHPDAAHKPEFDRRNCKVIGISVDGVEDHLAWSDDVRRSQGTDINFPLVGDPTLEIVKAFDMLPDDAGDTSVSRTATDNATARTVYIIGPDKRIKAMLTYPMTTGRNFAEVLRLLDSVQLTAAEQVATPANWQQGEDVIIVPSVSDEAAAEKYPHGWETPLPYLRLVKQPS